MDPSSLCGHDPAVPAQKVEKAILFLLCCTTLKTIKNT
jgi:hypothetical protein